MNRTATRRARAWFAAGVLVLSAVVLPGMTTGVASAAPPCGAGPALVFPGEKNHDVVSKVSVFGSPGYKVPYRVTNNGEAPVSVQVLGFDAAQARTWKGFPLSAGGAFDALTEWGNVSAVPTVRITNLDAVRTASVSFTC